MKSVLFRIFLLICLFLTACQKQPTFTQPVDLHISETQTAQKASSTPLPPNTSTHSPPTASVTPLTLTHTLTPTPVLPLVQPAPFTPTVPLPAGVTIHVYDLGRPVVAGEFEYLHVHKFLGAQSAFNEPGSWPTFDSPAEHLAKINQALQPFGYRISSLDDFTLYQGQKKLLTRLELLSEPSVNRSKTNFVMCVKSKSTGVYPDEYKLSKDGLELLPRMEVEVRHRGTWPQYIDDDLIYAQPEFRLSGPRPMMQVFRAGQMIYAAPPPTIIHARPELAGFWVFDDAEGSHWVLEILNHLHMDGRSMNEQYGYDHSYQFRRLGGKTMFMFEKGGVFGLNINGQELLLPGESVPHYNCCIGTFINPIYSEHAMAFFLKNGEKWKYVELVIQ